MTTLKEYYATINQAIRDDNGYIAALASHMIAPELIRVIELAEEALKIFSSYESCESLSIGDMCGIAEQALSEIRKLKGD